MARAGLTPDTLTRSGAELADRIGFDQVTPSALARHVGVKVQSLYAHVANAQDLKTRICLLALEEMADRAADAVAGRSGKDALAAFATVYRDYARRHPGRYEAARHPLDPRTAAASAGVRHAQMMRAVLRGYDLPEPEQTHAVRLLGSVFHGFTTLELAGSFAHSTPGPGESWAWTIDSLDRLLRTWTTP
ncbi:TetR/AcrR family transcriptional regulator [Streptomyces sp. QH1-20]|uniref:TetR/AcrR family transcriptional regulator n=1 Tax=Streptomyces sp. QH1-20 TaxID=3240934 RepID=UPI003517BE2E